MALANQRKRVGLRTRSLDSNDGIQFVRCRICGDRLRVISGRHLSKHGTDRETYMEEYNLSPDQLIAKDFRLIQSSRKGYQPYGKNDWVAALKKVYKKDGNVFAGYLQGKYPHLYNQGIWLFGNWNNALLEAGFDPERMRMHGLWDEEIIIEKIRVMQAKRLPLFAKYVTKNYQSLFSAAARHYGSWAKALVAAGVTKKPRTKKLYQGRLSLLNVLSDAIEGHTKNELPQALRREAAHYFGSLEKAIVALRKEEKLLPGWNRRKIITILSRMHRSKEGLAYAKAGRDHPTLVSAAEAHFGSWGKALHAAGIDPNLYFVHHRWRKTEVKLRK
jgi:hypothetical protein